MPTVKPLTADYLNRTLKIDFGEDLLEILVKERINSEYIFRLLDARDSFFHELPAGARLAIQERKRASTTKRKKARLATPPKTYDDLVPPPPPPDAIL